jgi:hypothetical protein
MTQREILLHVGHGKTGSSYIQSSLALSQAALAAAGIAYPINAKSELAGKAGRITSGNLSHAPDALADAVDQGFNSGLDRVLISSEQLFLALMGGKAKQFSLLRARFPGLRCRALLYVRDPLDHAVSIFQQRIKRAGFVGSFATSLEDYRVPLRVVQFMRAMEAVGTDVTVLNYSRHSKALLGSVEGWLGLPSGTLEKPPVEKINRSMTLAELELQRQFNILFPKNAQRFVSDPLCNRLPDIRSETPTVSREALAAFLDRAGQMISQQDVAAAIPDSEAYRLPELDDVAPLFASVDAAFPFAFNAAQLQVIAEAIHAEVQRQSRREPPARTPRNAEAVPPRVPRKRRV